MEGLLEFEQEMLLNVLHENSLNIISRGIGNDRLLANLVRTFSTPTHMVLVIGADSEEEDSVISQVINDCNHHNSSTSEQVDENFLPPKRITAESVAAVNRREQYLSGGVIFITTRILVVDMLTKRFPFESLSGIIVVNAHRVLKDCHISFILRLYRLHNKAGFITALSQNASSFLGSFAKLERIMRNLFVSKLFLWPRFHATISASFASRSSPNVVEMRIHMTPAMKQIQFALIDLISMCIKELTSMNSFIYSSSLDVDNNGDENSLNTINVISANFNKIIHANLDSVWFQLSARARRFIFDIRLLKSLLFHLTELDAVTFYGELKHIRDSVTPDTNPSDWLFWHPTDTLFKIAQERVFRMLSNEDSQNKSKRIYNIEVNPKLVALNDLLNEIEETVKHEGNEKRIRLDPNDMERDSALVVDIVIVVENRYAIYKIESFRDKGKDVVLDELKNKCDLLFDGKTMKLIREMQKEKKINSHSEESEVLELESQMTLTQMLGQLDSEENKNITRRHDRLQLHYFEWSADSNCALNLKRLLTSLKPQYIILYEPEMCCIRQIELYQALYGKVDKPPVNVYFFIFDGSAEEQRYLRNLQAEKNAFELLIEEKSKLAKVSHNDGLDGCHPDLERGPQPLLHSEVSSSKKSSRVGGSQNEPADRGQIRQVLVDMREFRSLLPSCIHKLDIELEPVTLEIGDYILTPDTCLERKSISDFIGSLNSGRLYSQSQSMTRYYKRPLLLIEFDEPKSFNFKARYWSSAQFSQSSSTVSRPSPLLQLALLTIHFPLLRLVWSPSPQFSADIIDQLKKSKEEPSKENVIRLSKLGSSGSLATVGGQELPAEYITDRYDVEAKELLLALPGVTTANMYSIMNQCKSIASLVELSIEELTELLGSSLHANQLHSALHDSMKLGDLADSDQSGNARVNQYKKRFTFVRKKKGQS